MRLAVKALVWLPILNCMSVLSGSPVARSATPVAPTKVPRGLQMPTRTPGDAQLGGVLVLMHGDGVDRRRFNEVLLADRTGRQPPTHR
jgi:hypothetical protein